jgi:hypothetical protein
MHFRVLEVVKPLDIKTSYRPERLKRIDYVKKLLIPAFLFLQNLVIEVNQVEVGHVDPFFSALIWKVILIQFSGLPCHWQFQVMLSLLRLRPIISIMIPRVLDRRI